MRDHFGGGGETRSHRALRRLTIVVMAVGVLAVIGASAGQALAPAPKAQVQQASVFVYTNPDEQEAGKQPMDGGQAALGLAFRSIGLLADLSNGQ